MINKHTVGKANVINKRLQLIELYEIGQTFKYHGKHVRFIKYMYVHIFTPFLINAITRHVIKQQNKHP